MKVKELVNVLEREIEITQKLVEIEKEKGKLLLKRDVDGIMKVTSETEMLTRELENLESKRLKIVRDIALEKGIHAIYPTVSTIAEYIDEEDAEILLNRSENLKNILITLREETIKNDAIITSGLAIINISLSLLKGKNSTYDDTGKKTSVEQGSSLVNQVI